MPIIFKNESYKILGACFNVYNELGSGFLEAVYQESLAIEFSKQSIPFKEQQRLQLLYKGISLNQKYIPDFYCFDGIVLEIKAHKNIDPTHCAQVINYLKASSAKLGILINFGNPDKLQFKRFAN